MRVRLQGWLVALITVLAVSLAGTSAQARGRDRHKVPDLRKAPPAAGAARYSEVELPVTMHIASARGRPIVSQRRVARWVERANEALAPHGMRVKIRAIRTLPRGYGHVTRWRHRRALAKFSPHDGTIHVFVVDRLELFAVRRADRSVRGMHWRYRGVRRKLANREYLVVTSDAPRTTLAHEIGHLFGLRHQYDSGNLMCSCRRGPGQSFTASQGAVMRPAASRFMRRAR